MAGFGHRLFCGIESLREYDPTAKKQTQREMIEFEGAAKAIAIAFSRPQGQEGKPIRRKSVSPSMFHTNNT